MTVARHKLGLVVNAPGLQVRRAEALRHHLQEQIDVEVVVAPTAQDVLRRTRHWDAVYVIDAGRAGFRAAVLSRLAGRPVIVELGDPQGALYAAQDRGELAVSVGRAIDRAVTLAASGIVVRGRELSHILDVRVPWVTIPDGVDLTAFRPRLGDDVRARLGFAHDDLVLGVVGSISWSERAQMCYGMEITEALAHLRDQRVFGLLVGDGSGVQHIVARAIELGVLDRLRLPGRVDHAEVPHYIGAMDVCLSTQTDDAVGRGRTTAKLPEYLACDRYVLSSAVPSAEAILPREMIIQRGSDSLRTYAVEVANRVRDLRTRQAELRDSGATRAIAERHFAYGHLAAKLHAFLEHVCWSARPGPAG